MLNTMVGGGEEQIAAGQKINEVLGEEIKKGERKKEKIA